MPMFSAGIPNSLPESSAAIISMYLLFLKKNLQKCCAKIFLSWLRESSAAEEDNSLDELTTRQHYAPFVLQRISNQGAEAGVFVVTESELGVGASRYQAKEGHGTWSMVMLECHLWKPGVVSVRRRREPATLLERPVAVWR